MRPFGTSGLSVSSKVGRERWGEGYREVLRIVRSDGTPIGVIELLPVAQGVRLRPVDDNVLERMRFTADEMCDIGQLMRERASGPKQEEP